VTFDGWVGNDMLCVLRGTDVKGEDVRVDWPERGWFDEVAGHFREGENKWWIYEDR
jgi:hypothetical protein